MNVSLRLVLQDSVIQALEREAAGADRPLEYIATALLQAATQQRLPVQGKFVVLRGEVLEQLEAILGGGSVLSQEDLLRKVEGLAGISFFHHRLPFSPSQLEQLQEKASRQGLTVEQLIDRAAPRVYEQFFDLLGRV